MAKATKKSKNKPYYHATTLLLLILAVAAYLAFIWLYMTRSYQSSPLPSGPLATAQAFSGTDYAHSLDLRVAAKASYPSTAVKAVRALPADAGLVEQVVSFGVPTDNLTEYGLMMRPAAKPPARGYPTLIICHGYYNPEQYQTTTGYLNDMAFYARHGFAVIKPDFRGQGDSINQGQPEGAYYSMAYNTDLMSLISAVRQTKGLDGGNINLWGHSMGAYVALRAAVLSPEIKNLILLSGPVGQPQAMFNDYSASSDRDNPVALKLRQSVLLKYGTPLTDPTFWNAAAPIDYLSQLNATVQIHVGSADGVVPPLFSAELDQALTQVGLSHRYYVYDDATHSLAEQRPLIWQRSLADLTSGTSR